MDLAVSKESLIRDVKMKMRDKEKNRNLGNRKGQEISLIKIIIKKKSQNCNNIRYFKLSL